MATKVILLLLSISLLINAIEYNGTVYWHEATQSYTLVKGKIDQKGVATVFFQDDMMTTGWGILNVHTNKDYHDDKQMYAAGYAEGAITWERIYQNFQNMYQEFFGDKKPEQNILDFFAKQNAWMEDMVEKKAGHHYWDGVGMILAQLTGLYHGYNDNVPDHKYKLSLFDLQFLNANGDLLDLRNAFDGLPDYDSMTPEEVAIKVASIGHCSAIVKIPGDLSDLWSSHSSWFTYRAMNRIYKHYHFHVNAHTGAKKVSFSSYPGYLSSLDDFYIMDNGLVMIQTTNGVFNQDLFKKYVHPESLWAWQRVRLANLFAHNGEEWAKIFAEHNSGTYNNQYMVIDYNKFKPGQPLQDNLLWVVEQIPGLVVSADMTSQLERGYWASYNVPFFPEIYNLSGYPDFVAKHGVDFSYQMAPRAQIFRRDQGKIVDLQSLKDFMRYNDYLNDPISNGNPGRAICSRFDLDEKNPGPGGCYDTKVTSYELQKSMTAHALNGPTTSSGLPVFSWGQFNTSNPAVNHFGQPDKFDFKFIAVAPRSK
jgi:hypothetical protein